MNNIKHEYNSNSTHTLRKVWTAGYLTHPYLLPTSFDIQPIRLTNSTTTILSFSTHFIRWQTRTPPIFLLPEFALSISRLTFISRTSISIVAYLFWKPAFISFAHFLPTFVGVVITVPFGLTATENVTMYAFTPASTVVGALVGHTHVTIITFQMRHTRQ